MARDFSEDFAQPRTDSGSGAIFLGFRTARFNVLIGPRPRSFSSFSFIASIIDAKQGIDNAGQTFKEIPIKKSPTDREIRGA